MRYRLFGYRKFSIRYDIGLKYRRYLYRQLSKRYRIVSEFLNFNRNFDIYIEFRYDIGSISYRIYFDIDINVDIASYRFVSKISIFISNFDLKKYRICLITSTLRTSSITQPYKPLLKSYTHYQYVFITS